MTPGADHKAQLLPLDANGSPLLGAGITVQFNPSTYSTLWNMTWNEIGQSLQWTRTAPGDLVLTLNYDSYEERTDVRDKTRPFKDKLDPGQSKTGQAVGCLFQWGKTTYKGVVQSLKEDFSLFLADGTPVRSVITLTLKPWPPTA
jgi:Contractile injection system tube protein